MFSEQGDQTPMKTGGLGDPASQSAFVVGSSEFYRVQNSFKAAGCDGPASQTSSVKTLDMP